MAWVLPAVCVCFCMCVCVLQLAQHPESVSFPVLNSMLAVMAQVRPRVATRVEHVLPLQQGISCAAVWGSRMNRRSAA
jgi:hypothetical protein